MIYISFNAEYAENAENNFIFPLRTLRSLRLVSAPDVNLPGNPELTDFQ
jgi:hypothetical protein